MSFSSLSVFGAVIACVLVWLPEPTHVTAAGVPPPYSVCRNVTAHLCVLPSDGSDPQANPLCPGAGVGCAAGFIINPLAPQYFEQCCDGFFCPIGLSCLAPCADGALCVAPAINSTESFATCAPYDVAPVLPGVCGGASEDFPCPVGYYCPTPLTKFPCPSGHFCPPGTISPQECYAGTPCGEGTGLRPAQGGLVAGMWIAAVMMTVFLSGVDRWWVIGGFQCSGCWDDYARLCRCLRCEPEPDPNPSAPVPAKDESKIPKPKPACIDRESCRSAWVKICCCGHPPSIRKGIVAAVPPHTCSICCYCCRVCCCLPGQTLCCCADGACSGETGVVDMTDDDDPNAAPHAVRLDAVGGQAIGGAAAHPHKRVLSDGDLPVRMVDQSEFNAQVTIECNNLDIAIKYPTLFHAAFTLEPNTVNAILGPSGAGKSTMLIPLAHKYDSYFDEVSWGAPFRAAGVGGSGDVKILTPEAIQYVIGRIGGLRERHSARKWDEVVDNVVVGFVPQNDIMPRYLTIRECIEFSAWWRLPGMSPVERRAAVDNVLREMNFKPQDESKQIGTEETGGISGGQRKRVNVAMELVANPHVLFLDEPTSGLDAVMSQKLMAVLKKRAAHGMTIALVVHQPRLEIWNEFNKVVLLRQLPRPTDPFYGQFFSVAVQDSPLNATIKIRKAVEHHDAIAPKMDHTTNNAADYCLDALACEGEGNWLDMDAEEVDDPEQPAHEQGDKPRTESMQAQDLPPAVAAPTATPPTAAIPAPVVAAAAPVVTPGAVEITIVPGSPPAVGGMPGLDRPTSLPPSLPPLERPTSFVPPPPPMMSRPISGDAASGAAGGPPSVVRPASSNQRPVLGRPKSSKTTRPVLHRQETYNAAIALAHAASGSYRSGAPYLEQKASGTDPFAPAGLNRMGSTQNHNRPPAPVVDRQLSAGTATKLRSLAPNGPRQTVSFQTAEEALAQKQAEAAAAAAAGGSGGSMSGGMPPMMTMGRTVSDVTEEPDRPSIGSQQSGIDEKAIPPAAGAGEPVDDAAIRKVLDMPDLEVDVRSRLSVAVRRRATTASKKSIAFEPDWIGRAGRGTRRRAPQAEFGTQFAVFVVKELVRVIRAPDQFFFICLMALASSFLVGKLNPNPEFTSLPAVNVLSMMALAIIAAVQSVELYGDEADRLSYFRESARARNNTFLVALFLAKQLTSVFYLFFIPALYAGVFTGMSDTTLTFAQYYGVLIGGYFVSQSYGQMLSVMVSPASKQLIGSTSVLILCFLSGQNPTLPDLGSFRIVADILSFTRYQCEMLVHLQSEALTPVFRPLAQAMAVHFAYDNTASRYSECAYSLFLQGIVARIIAFFVFLLKDRYKRFKN